MYKTSLINLPKDKKKKNKIIDDNFVIRKKVKIYIPKKSKREPFELKKRELLANLEFNPLKLYLDQNSQHNNETLKQIENELRKHFYNMSKTNQKGGSFFKKALGGISDVFNRVKTTITGRNDLQPTARKIMSEYGNERITNILIVREPIISAINKIINIISLGKQTYDTLFHLFMIVTTDKGHKILIEKNHVINISSNIRSLSSKSETLDIPVTRTITLNELIDNTKKYMGSNFLYYSASQYNCQNFIDCILNANHLNSEKAKHFILQKPEEIFKHMPSIMPKFMNAVTGLASKADVLLNGVGKKKRKINMSNVDISKLYKIH